MFRDAFYGWAVACGLALSMLIPSASAFAMSYKILYAFGGGSDGSGPTATVIEDEGGNLYGTTEWGGNYRCRGYGCGTIFKLAPNGSESVLHIFDRDGSHPAADLLADNAGNFYGTTSSGGAQCTKSRGTVFEQTADGTEHILHTFCHATAGKNPYGDLIADKVGDFYGTTYGGGKAGCKGGCGTVFELAPDGKEMVLYAFAGGSDGANPFTGLIVDGKGNFYGTTTNGGGTGCGGGGCGIVFKLAPNGTETVLYSFAGGNDGDRPQAKLIVDQAGILYGTTLFGGSGCDCGTMFKLTPDGTETMLHVFTGGSDGAWPSGNLIADNAGNLYGTATIGGSTDCNGEGCGTAFELAPDGTFTVLHTFAGGSDGANPEGGLMTGMAGNFYGTTAYGGVVSCNRGIGCGTVFELTP